MRSLKTLFDEERYQQLLALAAEGDENAIADLFKEFGYQYPACASQGRPKNC
jgi:hypothetical protein